MILPREEQVKTVTLEKKMLRVKSTNKIKLDLQWNKKKKKGFNNQYNL